MKKLLFLASLFGCSTVALAQLPVSTATENKNAVLEEFTGIYCTFCPDGHLRAQQFADANPGDVVLINIHAGGYANPQGSDPDFRTPWGAAIDGQSGLAGYPAGTMNRRVFTGHQQGSGTAQSRGSWATTGAIIVGEGSYANIAMEATLDFGTGVLTVDVETYFTGVASGAMSKLNVAVLQSNVEGPQTGMAANPGQVLPNGNYSHNHMLRELLTGQWGVDVPTTQGVVNSYTYTWTVPNDINGVAVALADLEVVSFLAESQQEIVTGTKGPITFNLPPGMSIADMEAVGSMATPAGYCNSSVVPEFTIKNNEAFAVDSAEASFTLNGATPVTMWVTNIPANGTKVVTFPSATLSPGENAFNFGVSVNGVSKYVDVVSSNNSNGDTKIISVNPTPFGTFHTEGFEGLAQGTPAPPNALQINPNGSNAFVVHKGINTQVITWGEIGGYGNSINTYRFRNFNNPVGEEVDLLFEKLDLTSVVNNEIRFVYAYAQYGTEADGLDVSVSNDCGATWNSVWYKDGSDLATTANVSTGDFYPKAADWKSVNLNLAAYDGDAELMIRFKGISAFGNNVYVDDIMLVNSANVSLEENDVLSSINVYPNPSSANTNVEFDLTNTSIVNVTLTDLTGKLISQPVNGEMTEGNHKVSLDLSNVQAGVYLVEITVNGVSKIEKLIVE